MMNYLLFGGAPSVGKSEAIIRLELFLNSKRITTTHKQLLPNGDFYACLDGTDSNGTKVRILVSSAADTPHIIHGFKSYCNLYPLYDFIISAVRDDGDPDRNNFFSTMVIKPSDCVLEIPMGKITRKNNYTTALAWYSSRIDALAQTILGNAPFFI
jgi:hypothetical protein